MQAPVPMLNTLTLPPGATETQARIVLDGVRGAIFEYAAGGPLGALVSSWARTAGTDPYGNVYPQGFSAGAGSVFAGTDFNINSDGAFFYDGTPAAGNLLLTITNPSASGTDSYGNTYAPGGVCVVALADLKNVLSIQDTSGNTLATIDASGNITGTTVSANNDLIINGQSWNNSIYPPLPQGTVSRGYAPGSYSFPWPSTAIGTTETALFELDVTIPAGREYLIAIYPSDIIATVTANTQYVQKLRYTTDGTTPTTSSTEAVGHSPGITPIPSALSGLNFPTPYMEFIPPIPSSDMVYKFLVTAFIQNGTFQYHNFIEMRVQDIGNLPSANQATVLGGGSSGGSSKQTYTKTYSAVSTYSYQGSDGHQPDAQINENGSVVQGGDYADTYNGDCAGYINWPYSTIESDLSGATVNSVQLKLSNQHSWYNSGMTVVAGLLGAQTYGSTKAPPTTPLNDQFSFSIGEGQTLTVTCPSSWGTSFQSGGAAVTVLYPGSNNLTYYGYFAGGTSPQLIINYTK